MKIKFFDSDGGHIITIVTEAQDHWDACLEGHRILGEGTVAGADDFDVIEDHPEVLMADMELNQIIRTLRRFNDIDPKMQVSTILTFLEIAKAEGEARDISVQDIERLVGLKSGTASRNVYYWAGGHKDMAGGFELVNASISSEDRRRRELRLTAKGKTFLTRLIGG